MAIVGEKMQVSAWSLIVYLPFPLAKRKCLQKIFKKKYLEKWPFNVPSPWLKKVTHVTSEVCCTYHVFFSQEIWWLEHVRGCLLLFPKNHAKFHILVTLVSENVIWGRYVCSLDGFTSLCGCDMPTSPQEMKNIYVEQLSIWKYLNFDGTHSHKKSHCQYQDMQCYGNSDP